MAEPGVRAISIVADPAKWKSLHLDADTVTVLADTLDRYPGGGDITAGMLEDFQDWLAEMRPESGA